MPENFNSISIKPMLGDSQLSPFVIDARNQYPSNLSVVNLASTEVNDVQMQLARSVKFATGAITNQRAVYITAPTYAFLGASTITNASTVSISGPPIAGTNATITNLYSLNIESGKTKINDKLEFANIGYIKSTTSGANEYIDVFPSAAVSATNWILRVARDNTYNYGPVIYCIQSDTLSTTTGTVKLECPVSLGNDKSIFLGTNAYSLIRHSTQGNDTLQISVTCNSANTSSALALVSNGTAGTANRSPVTASVLNPIFMVYSADNAAGGVNDFISLTHDQTDGKIICGAGNLNISAATNVYISSGLRLKRTATAVSVSAAITDTLIGVTSTAAARTITMPSAVTVGEGAVYIIKDESGGAAAFNISVACAGGSGQTFDGAASPVVAINTNYGSTKLYSNGANWFFI